MHPSNVKTAASNNDSEVEMSSKSDGGTTVSDDFALHQVSMLHEDGSVAMVDSHHVKFLIHVDGHWRHCHGHISLLSQLSFLSHLSFLHICHGCHSCHRSSPLSRVVTTHHRRLSVSPLRRPRRGPAIKFQHLPA